MLCEHHPGGGEVGDMGHTHPLPCTPHAPAQPSVSVPTRTCRSRSWEVLATVPPAVLLGPCCSSGQAVCHTAPPPFPSCLLPSPLLPHLGPVAHVSVQGVRGGIQLHSGAKQHAAADGDSGRWGCGGWNVGRRSGKVGQGRGGGWGRGGTWRLHAVMVRRNKTIRHLSTYTTLSGFQAALFL